MAAKIIRQPKKIALLGAPSSAAALAGGHERGPSALRAAGLVERLRDAGWEITDYGDCATHVFQTDDEHPRARNVAQVLAALEELRPKVEVAIKSGALPIVLGGDCSTVLATVAAARRYFRNISLIYADRDADLNVPATTSSGCVDGMALSHVIGRGAPELVRFWGEPPLVREPNVTLFGVERVDPPEQQFLQRSPLRRYHAEDVARRGASAAAEEALQGVHARNHRFVLHIDLDVIAGEDFRSANLSAPGGLRFDEVRQALTVFVRQPTLAVLEICAYNPNLDADGSAAKRVIDLLVEVLSPRLEDEAAQEPQEPSDTAANAAAASAGSSPSEPGGPSAGDAQASESTPAAIDVPAPAPESPPEPPPADQPTGVPPEPSGPASEPTTGSTNTQDSAQDSAPDSAKDQ